MNRKKINRIGPDDFKGFDKHFQESLEVAQALDAKAPIPHSIHITAYEVCDFLAALTPKRFQLLKLSKKSPRSIAELATAAHRDPSAVSKDVARLVSLGLVTVVEELNAGHGIKKVVRPVASSIEIRASLI